MTNEVINTLMEQKRQAEEMLLFEQKQIAFYEGKLAEINELLAVITRLEEQSIAAEMPPFTDEGE